MKASQRLQIGWGWVTEASHLAKLEADNFSEVASTTFGPDCVISPFPFMCGRIYKFKKISSLLLKLSSNLIIFTFNKV